MRRGRPRISDEPNVQVSLNIPESLYLRFAAETNRRCVAKNLLLRRILEKALPEWEHQKI